jgi:YD repeat-containing protein
VTYNSYATTNSLAISPSSLNAYNGKRYVTTYTPTLSAKVTDADGSTVKAQFEITNDPSYSGETSYSYTGTSASVASGATAKLAIPSASQLAGAHLRMRVRGYDGTDYGAWSSYIYFVPNVAKPSAPTITCDPYTEQTWTSKASGSVTCTLDTSSSDGQGYLWGLDDSSTPKSVYDTADGNGGDPLTISIAPGEDWHTLYAKTIDSGGSLSTSTTTYAFGVGNGAGLLTPGDGDSAARRLSLTSTGKTTYTGVTYQYRRGETDSWTPIPLADVTKSSDGSAVSTWPVTVSSGTPAALTWNVTNSLSQDGSLDIRAAFTDGTTTAYSSPHTVIVDRNAGMAPSKDVGPGTVNTLTGDFTLSSADASDFGLSVSRTASSRRPTAGSDAEGQVAIFGPQWTAGTTAELTDSDWVDIRKTSATSVALVDVDGNETGFTATSSGGWKSEPGSEDLTLTSKNSSGTVTNDLTQVSAFTLKDDEGTTNTFAKVDPAATTWQVASTYLPTDNSTTKVVSEKVTSGSSTLARPKYLIAPTSAVTADQCQTAIDAATAAGHDYFSNASTNTGCRVLQFVYATSTTATSSTLGNYTGQAQQIKQWAVTPGDSTTTATPVAQYAYDDSGRLREQWDPRISPALKTSYDYDGSGHITTLTPPGELPWTLAYNTVGNAATAGPGMLISASRPTLTPGSTTQTNGTAITSVVYSVPPTGSAAPNAMGAADIAAWGQEDIPADATAVFPADQVPTSHDGTALAAGDYQRATITYTDASGREVNTASPGSHITSTEYDQYGNTVRELTAGNRELALSSPLSSRYTELQQLGIEELSTADRAQQLSTTSVFNATGFSADAGTDKDTDPANVGQRQLEQYGPLHLVTLASTLTAPNGGADLAAGTVVPARQHVVTKYDEGRPSGGTASTAN